VAGQAKADASSTALQYHHADAEARLAEQVNELKKAGPTTGSRTIPKAARLCQTIGGSGPDLKGPC